VTVAPMETRRPGYGTASLSELTHGDEARVLASAPVEFRPTSRAWVVGIRADPAGGSDDVLLVIEFDDGSSMEVRSDLVQKASSIRRPVATRVSGASRD
jgi:hypothetical protein